MSLYQLSIMDLNQEMTWFYCIFNQVLLRLEHE